MSAGHTQVAQAMVDGVATRAFIPLAADASSGFLIGSCLTPCSPRRHPLVLDMLLAPGVRAAAQAARGAHRGQDAGHLREAAGQDPRRAP